MDKDAATELARLGRILGVETRVRIIQLLQNRALCVGALAARLEVTQGAVSQHLRILRDAGLVTPHKRGYFVHYRLNEEVMARWRAEIDRLLKAGTKERPCFEPPSTNQGGEHV